MKKSSVFLVLAATVSLFTACKTLPKFKGDADLCGLIVDENNAPVKDFLIYCKNDLETDTALTDESGMFVIHGASAGDYKISGQRNNFVRLEDTQFLFTDRNKIFCCQVESIDGALKTVEKLILQGEKKKAEELLDKLEYEKKTPQDAVVQVYRFFLAEKNRDKKKIIASIRKIGRIDNTNYSNYADMLEEMINEQ